MKSLRTVSLGANFTGSYKKSVQGDSLRFTTMLPEVPGTHLIKLRTMRGCVNLRATQWF